MNKNEILIDLYLEDPQCTMIGPRYKYPRDKHDFHISGAKKIAWNPDNLVKLENMVSHCMTTRHQQELVETLTEKIPILYIDCSQKWADDIMFFIFKEYSKQSKTKNKDVLIAKVIWDHTIVTESRPEWEQYIQKNKPTLEEMFTRYDNLLKQTLIKYDEHQDGINFLLKCEASITFHGLSTLMESENQKYIYIYLDKVWILSIDEQQRINTFLYARWGLPHSRRVRLKINNGNGVWRTRQSSTGHSIQSTHDYSEVNIHEDELE